MRVPILDLSTLTLLPVPVATRSELRRAGSMRVSALGESLLLLWNDGRPGAFRDCCPHLGMPLSEGHLDGDVLRCRYHGWTFDRRSGELGEQPTLRRPRPCRLQRFGALRAGDLVFVWRGDPEAKDAVRARLPPRLIEGASVYRVTMSCPFYLALFNAVDYAHFARHSYYRRAYSIYRKLIRGGGHVPGMPFSSKITAEDEHSVEITFPEAQRVIRMYAGCAEYEDAAGVNHFQSFATPLSADRCVYWETYTARHGSPLVRAAARAAFWTLIVPLLATEDRRWTGASSAAFLDGRNIHLGENDLPLGAHLRKFVLPAMGARP